MSTYRNVHTKLWSDKDILSSGKDSRYLFLYLITNKHINNSGVYELPLTAISFETGMPLPTIKKLFASGEPKNVFYDFENEIVFIKNARAYHRGGNPAKVEKGILNEFKQTHKTPLWNLFLEANPYFKELFGTVPEPLANGSIPIPLPLPIPIIINNKKEKKAKVNETAVRILEHLNQTAGKNFKPTVTNLGFINARLAEGFTEEELKYVAENRVAHWLGTGVMFGDSPAEDYLRPSTLFNTEKCGNYLASKMPGKIKSKPKTKAFKNLETLKEWGEEYEQGDIQKRAGSLIDGGDGGAGQLPVKNMVGVAERY
jgi:uncharacterized phage protein (TIGR02220 family)